MSTLWRPLIKAGEAVGGGGGTWGAWACRASVQLTGARTQEGLQLSCTPHTQFLGFWGEKE